MKFAVGFFPTAEAISPGDLGALLEERGHEALFFAEHTHIPGSRLTPWPPGGDMPAKYERTYDPFVASTNALAATTRLRVGTGVCLVAQRDPILTAKEVASVDRLSGGRFEFGIGAGWNREEMESHGTDPRLRMGVMAERIAAIKTIWAEEEASFHGRFVDFDRVRSWPKPAQTPHPPILVGGHGPKVLDRVLSFGDAWFPNFGEAENLAERILELKSRAERPIEVHVMNAPADAATLQDLFEIGASRVGHWLPTGTRSVVLAALERWEMAIGELFGER